MNVLLVDDDAICNLISQKTLERMGIARQVQTARNGAEAIGLLSNIYQRHNYVPDIILLDLNMPILDGFGFLEAFNRLSIANKESVRIIILTSSIDPGDVRKVRALGVRHYLTKPISPEKLTTALQQF